MMSHTEANEAHMCVFYRHQSLTLAQNTCKEFLIEPNVFFIGFHRIEIVDRCGAHMSQQNLRIS